ncbi:MAG: kinase/pyrophosphorylase [Phycisphaerales bacterium]|jgi:regulator of PEP synthase PpsR (kinase-PPPase family)|nr:kinase/pyrophosphorylase [Phycisphaerales bacterium]
MSQPRRKTTRKKAAKKSSLSAARPIYILSDSTGNLARHMLTAILTQFPESSFTLRTWTFLRTKEQIHQALKSAVDDKAIIFHAMVSDEDKQHIANHCRQLGLSQCDLTGGFVEFLSSHSGVMPTANLGRLHFTSHEYHHRIRSLEFTLDHDDGLGLETIHKADLVLTGVSRTSKTPTSIYLAQQGYRVANVALAMGIDPPAQLLALKEKVVGLVIDPMQLSEIRTNRQTGWRMGNTSYNDPQSVSREVAWSKKLFVSRGWPILDVTDQAIEETAARIVNLLRLEKPFIPPNPPYI